MLTTYFTRERTRATYAAGRPGRISMTLVIGLSSAGSRRERYGAVFWGNAVYRVG